MELICGVPWYCGDGSVTGWFWLSIILGATALFTVVGWSAAVAENVKEAAFNTVAWTVFGLIALTLAWLLISYFIVWFIAYNAFRIGVVILAALFFTGMTTYSLKKYKEQR
jgi:hypothetical protein